MCLGHSKNSVFLNLQKYDQSMNASKGAFCQKQRFYSHFQEKTNCTCGKLHFTGTTKDTPQNLIVQYARKLQNRNVNKLTQITKVKKSNNCTPNFWPLSTWQWLTCPSRNFSFALPIMNESFLVKSAKVKKNFYCTIHSKKKKKETNL